MVNETLTYWFNIACTDQATSPVIHVDGASFDCVALSQQVEILIQFLRARTIGKGHTLALSTSSSWLFTLLMYASSELGATLYLLDPRLDTQLRKALLDRAGVNYLLTYEGNAVFELDITAFTITPLKQAQETESDAAVMIATSGSSGDPRGVMLGWGSIFNSARTINHQLDFGSSDCWLNCLPLYHIGGLSILFRTALAGASMVLHQGFDAECVWRDIKHYGVTHLSLVPVMLEKLLAVTDGAPPEHLRVAVIGGAALNEDLAQRALAADWPLFVTYGMSETSSQVATKVLTFAAEINTPIPLLEGMECSVIDENGKLTDKPGLIRLRGNLLMHGYANSEHRKGNGLDEAGWYTTGDIGSYQPAEGVKVTGRTDELIISGGEKIHPQQVEWLMQTCPEIDELCVTGVADAEWGEKVCVVYSGKATEQAIELWCRENIQGPTRPRLFVRLPELPRLSNGKINRHLLRQ